VLVLRVGAGEATEEEVTAAAGTTRGCYEVCTKIGAYVGGQSYPGWKDGKQGESRLSERRFG
jgi:hypothetical protein